MSFGVYIHVPFCKLLCPYCDFVKRRFNPEHSRAFVDGLMAEIERFQGPSTATSVFFGGGTPSLLAFDELERILGAVRARFTVEADGEISLEANPDDITPEAAQGWRELGVTRVSLGVQSFDDRALRYLGRVHDAARAREACAIVRETFPDWGVDLIFGAHPTDGWRETVEECVAWKPTHVSTYGLTYEPRTPFAKRSHEAVGGDAYVELYEEAHAVLTDVFRHYEVSNYARPGWESRHNLIYWHNGGYAGFGPGAYSYYAGIRSQNHRRLRDYLGDPGGKLEALRLTPEEIRLETVMQYLRLEEGLPFDVYAARFGRQLMDDFGAALRGLEARGLVTLAGGRAAPTLRGFDLNNEIGLALMG